MNSAPRYHPLVYPTFLLTCFLFLLPVHADLAFGLVISRRIPMAALLTCVCVTVVAVPMLIARRQTKRNPARWKPRLLEGLTWVIIAGNVALHAVIYANVIIK